MQWQRFGTSDLGYDYREIMSTDRPLSIDALERANAPLSRFTARS